MGNTVNSDPRTQILRLRCASIVILSPERFPDLTALRKRQRRDRCKADICAQRGIRLVLVHDEDLSLSGMQRKVAGLLPLRDLDENRQLVRAVKDLCREYRQRAALPLPMPLCKSS